MAKRVLLLGIFLVFGFGAGALLTFLLCFSHAVIRHGGLW